MKFVFWWPMLNIHQSADCQALTQMGHEVTVVAEQELAAERRALGIDLPQLPNVQVIIAPGSDTITQLARQDTGTAVHLITGTRGWQTGRSAFQACREAGARIGLVQEGGDPRGLKGGLRRALYVMLQIQLSRDVNFLLAMGDTGVRWYRTCGWPCAKVLPYAYFMETPPSSVIGPVSRNRGTDVELIYVGQLIKRKGVDLLLLAIAQLADNRWRLSIVGDGQQRQDLERLARDLGVASRIRFCGALRHDQAMDLVVGSDYLVLPSRFDGWGAVVSEALMRGTPVICSDQCGSAALIKESWRGATFRAGSSRSLAGVLGSALAQGKKTQELSQRLRSWSRRIEGSAAASYLLQTIVHVYDRAPRPLPPWDLEECEEV